ncbi:MAG: InlB B-repeat-containing protein, partial [Anaerovoracaceae bacterium]
DLRELSFAIDETDTNKYYRCMISSMAYSDEKPIFTDAVLLGYKGIKAVPVITENPENQILYSGNMVNFYVECESGNPVTYVWEKTRTPEIVGSWTAFNRGTFMSPLLIFKAKDEDDGLFFRCKLTVGGATLPVYSEIAKLYAPSKYDAVLKCNATDGEKTPDNVISMQKAQPFSFEFAIKDPAINTKSELKRYIDGGKVVLFRDKGKTPDYIAPYQFVAKNDIIDGENVKGRGRLDKDDSRKGTGSPWQLKDWVRLTAGGVTTTPYATSINNAALDAENASISFNVATLFGTTANQASIDAVGEYKLQFIDAKGNVAAETEIRITPYESYHTMQEVYDTIDEIVEYGNKHTNYFVEKRSMGRSSAYPDEFGTETGLDMPYYIIAKDKKSVDEYMLLKERAEDEPDKVLAELNAGTLEYKIPLLSSNIHPGEAPGVDATIDFTWNILSNAGGKIKYKDIDGMTEAGKERYQEMTTAPRGATTNIAANRVVPRDAFSTLPEEKRPTNTGFLQETNLSNLSQPVPEELFNSWYNVSNKELDVDSLLDNVILIMVPAENVVGRTAYTREGRDGYDLNRDNLFQTTKETQNMTKMIAEWNPSVFWEHHSTGSNYQVEPCTPPHEPNYEYDLLAQNSLMIGEALGDVGIANNKQYNNYRLAMRDYLFKSDDNSTKTWNVWDDVSTAYTPSYSMLHGTIAGTLEMPRTASKEEHTVKLLSDGVLGTAAYMVDNKKSIYENQLKIWERGVKGVDATSETLGIWYGKISAPINQAIDGQEANIMRPKYTENGNFFPEYYVIPMDSKSQRNLDQAEAMEKWLIDNDVNITTLKENIEIKNAKGKDVDLNEGSIVVDMHQAKRGVANAALSDGLKIQTWGTTLYSEPVTALPKLRGLNCEVITKKNAFEGKLEAIEEPTKAKKADIDSDFTIILNSGQSSNIAINKMLSDKKEVALISEGEHKGSFLVTTSIFNEYSEDYSLNAIEVKNVPNAKILDEVSIFINTNWGEFNGGTAPYGSIYAPWSGSSSDIGYVRKMMKDMNFKIDKEYSARETDVLFGPISVNTSQRDRVREGDLAYVGWGANASLSAISILGESDEGPGAITAINRTNEGSNIDAIFDVIYTKNDSYITAPKIAQNDSIMYNYGASYITSIVPTPSEESGVSVLARIPDTNQSEWMYAGAASVDRANLMQNSIQAYEYKKDNINFTAFAGSLARKANQKDDIMMATSAIYEAAATKKNLASKVTFDILEGERIGGGELTQFVLYGASAAAPTVERIGYTFLGWDNDFDSITEDITITANWEIKTFKVSFDVNGGTRTGGGELVQSINYEATAIAPEVERVGYDFIAWDKEFSNIKEEIIVKANWEIKTFKVSFDVNGGTRISGGEESQTVNYGAPAVAPTVERIGYTFLGWDNDFDAITEDITITANWLTI